MTFLAITATVAAAFTDASIVVAISPSSLHIKADSGRGLSCELVGECVHCVAPLGHGCISILFCVRLCVLLSPLRRSYFTIYFQ